MNLDHTWIHIMNKEGKGRRLTKKEFIQKMKAKSSLKKSSFDENSEF